MASILVFFICFIGSLIQGATGFGFAIFTMSILPFIIPFKTASVIVSFLIFTIGIQMAYILRRNINLKILIVPILSSIITSMFGVYLLMICNEDVAKKFLGGLLILLSAYFAFYSKKNIKLNPNINNGIIIGIISGLSSGMFNIGGPPLVIYYFYAASDSLEFKASIEFNFAILALYTTIMHMAYGNINLDIIKYTAIGIISVVIAGFVGIKIFKKLDKNVMSKCIYTLMFFMGIFLVIKG